MICVGLPGSRLECGINVILNIHRPTGRKTEVPRMDEWGPVGRRKWEIMKTGDETGVPYGRGTRTTLWVGVRRGPRGSWGGRSHSWCDLRESKQRERMFLRSRYPLSTNRERKWYALNGLCIIREFLINSLLMCRTNLELGTTTSNFSRLFYRRRMEGSCDNKEFFPLT